MRFIPFLLPLPICVSKMICELCGGQYSKGFKVRIEGSIILACEECSKSKEVIGPAKQKPAVVKIPKKKNSAGQDFDVDQDFDIVENYGDVIKKVREKKDLTQTDLGKKINESHSLIHRIELEKIEPTKEVARKIERFLGVKLLLPHHEIEAQQYKSENKDLTLGDMIVVRKRSK